MKRRLTAADTNSRQPATSWIKKGEQLVNRDLLPALAESKTAVVAEWAAHITARRENRAGDLTRVVQQRQLL